MLQVFEIELSEIKRYVTVAFCGDHELINKYHIVNGRLSDCVESTVNQIKTTANDYVLRCYAIFHNSLPIGFTVISIVSRLLYSFGINILYRRKELLRGWVHFVKSTLTNGITCVLHAKNTRTIDFLISNGFRPETAAGGLITLEYNIKNAGKSCPTGGYNEGNLHYVQPKYTYLKLQ